jgi:hypothetical protein
MIDDIPAHYWGLLAAYATAVALVWLVKWIAKPAFLANPAPHFEKPWLELGLALLAVAAIVGVGQLYVAEALLPRTSKLNEMLNQLIIFSPMVLLVAVRPQPLRSAFVTPRAMPGGLVLGVALAFAALGAYTAVRGYLPPGDGLVPAVEYPRLVSSVFHPELLHNGVQVFLEDFAVAALLSRLAASIGGRGAIVVVAALFAAAHAPTMIAEGVSATEIMRLAYDAVLGAAVLGTVLATRSIWWFFPVHFVMDMSQFYPR